MIRMIYNVSPEEKQSEIDWLREQKIFPGIDEYYDWVKQKPMVSFGVIVSPEAALSIKLRHKLEIQDEYHQR